MAKYEVDNALEELDGTRITALLTSLNEQIYHITNALGLPDKVEDGAGKEKKGGKLNLAAIERAGNQPIKVEKQQRKNLMPQHMIYKDEDAPVEDTQVPEDSQDKELESKLETALEALKRYKHTLSVPLNDVQIPTDER
jgi:hypothetical protein